jgi:CubicO group peptidase (beta-lactamase class C family)
MKMTKTGKRLLTAVIVVLVGSAIGALAFLRSRDTPKSKAEVVQGIDADLRDRASKGLAGSLLLAQDGEVILLKGYGLADRSTGRAVTPDTGFDIGSLVKTFTGVAVLQLEDAGKLHLNDTIVKYFSKVPATEASLTIQTLLDHSSGLPDIVDVHSKPVDYTPDFDYEPVSRDEIVNRALHAQLIFSPGQKTGYSNLGYSLLGVIIEIASGQTYEQYLQEHIFRPAGMTRTGYTLPGWKRDDLAVGYYKGARWGTPLDHPWLQDGPSWNLRANGGMLSTVRELYKFIQALDRDDVLRGDAKQKYLQLSVHKNARGTRTMGGAGSNEVFDAAFLWYLDEHRALIMLTSSDRHRAEKMIPDFAREMRRIRPG